METRSFKDAEGRTWIVRVDVNALRRVKALAGIDLMDVVNDQGRMLARLEADPVTLVDVLYAICKPDADAKGVTDETFGAALLGDAIDTATSALLESLADFSPAGRRAVLRKACSKIRQYSELLQKTALERLDSPEMDEMVKTEIESALTLGGPSMTAPESAELIQADSHSTN